MPRFRRVIAGVSGSPRNLPALRFAADLACSSRATLVPVHAWVPPGSDLPDCPFIPEHLLQEWEQAARHRLCDTLDLAFGGALGDVPVEAMVVQGSPRAILVGASRNADDVLVIGTGRRGAIRRWWHGTVSRYCLAHAGCPVIAIPPPALESGPGLRSWALRHRVCGPLGARVDRAFTVR